MRKRIVSACLLLSLLTCCISGCGVVDTAKGMVNKKMEQMVVGESEKVASISTEQYAYQQLTEEEKIVYDQILDCILQHSEKVAVMTKDKDLLQKVYDCVMADYGGLFWIDGYQFNTYTSMDQVIGIEFMPRYTMTKEQADEYQAQIDAVVEEWMAGIGPNDSDFAKSKYVFETLVNQVEYNKNSENNQNILSVFLGKSTVCQGYADATQYLLQQLGIQSAVVRGKANGEAHAWNLVRLDGEYYFTDTTWGNSRYLMPDSSIQKFVNYDYLNATTAFMQETHELDVCFDVPECTATACHYQQ